jgi:hypothetical protein
MSFYDLRDAMALPGCPVCRLKADAVGRYLDGLLWESVNDAGVRHDIRQARGFCHQHAWQLVHAGASVGSVIIMRDVMHTVLEKLERVASQPFTTSSLQRARGAIRPRKRVAAAAGLVAELNPQGPCPACAQAENIETVVVDTLIESLLGGDGLLEAYRASEGLCLPHLRQALTRVRDQAVFDALVEVQRDIWEQLVGHLDEIIRKADYRFRHEPIGEEAGAGRRVIAALAGSRLDPT